MIFTDAGIADIPDTPKKRVLNRIANVVKPSKQPVITRKYKAQRLEWTESNLNIDFKTAIFTDECRATLDGPDGWSKSWLREVVPLPARMRRQQGGGGVMFWSGIVGNIFVGPFKRPEEVKLSFNTYSLS